MKSRIKLKIIGNTLTSRLNKVQANNNSYSSSQVSLDGLEVEFQLSSLLQQLLQIKVE